MPRKQHTYHYIYKTTCTITSKYYVGMHSCSNLEDGYMGSGTRLKYSIRKYGIENHIKEILEFTNDRASLVQLEADIVNEKFLQDPLCMNLQKGGAWDQQSWKPKQYRPLSESHKASLRKAMKGIAGKYERTPEIKEKISETLKKQQQTEDARQKRSESHKKYWAEHPEEKENKKLSTLKGWETRRQKQEMLKKNNT